VGSTKGKSDIHKELLEWLIESNLPEPEIDKSAKRWMQNIVVGLRVRGIDPCDVGGLVEQGFYRKMHQGGLSRRRGFLSPSAVSFIDFLVSIKSGGNRFWIIEGKEELNYEAIGQVLTYTVLFEQDHPSLGEIRMGIACKSVDDKFMDVCKKYKIEVFVKPESWS